MKKYLQMLVAAVLAAHVGVCAEMVRPVPATYIMVCCHAADKGTKFLANGEWDARHDYGDYVFALDQMRKIKESGINVVGVDFTNPSQWDQFKAHHWPMLQNVVRAAKELDMQYFLFLGNTCAHTMKYWNEKAKIVWEEFAQDPHYRRYGFGDDRPMMTIFLPGRDFAAHLKRSKPEEKNWLEKFRIGTCQVNDPIVPTPTDGWGYRNKSAGSTDLARFVAPNSGVGPKEWVRVDANEWRARVKWALGAKEYAVIGTYDDTCDCIFWGIADVRGSRNPIHVHKSTKNDPYAYYNIVKEEIAKRNCQGGCRAVEAATWPDGSPMDAWFADRSPVAEVRLGPLRRAQEFGVKPDVDGLQTGALQRAIDAIASDGGGVLVLGLGVWNTSALFFKPKVHLKLEKGAVLRGPEDGSAVPRGMTHFVGHSFVYTLALINADACNGFTIYGEGTIDGNGKKSWVDFWKKRKTVKGFKDWDIPRPRNVYVSNSRDVRISGVTIKDSHFWTVQFYKCERVKVDNVRITAPGRKTPPAAPSSDAIDLDAVKDAHVWGSYMDVNDDAVVMKGGWGYKCETLPDNGANFNILVEDCVFGPVCHHAFTCGSDAFHCRNLILRNSEVRGCGALLNLKSRPDTRQLYEHILVENVSGWCRDTMRMIPWMQWYNLPDGVGKQETRATNVVKQGKQVM